MDVKVRRQNRPTTVPVVEENGPVVSGWPAATATAAADDAELLDAARAEFIAHGLRRTSVAEVARRANVSRPTVYRRLGDKDDIVRAVAIREAMRFFNALVPKITALETTADRAVEAFVASMLEWHANDLARAVLRYDRDALADLVTGVESAESLRIVRDGASMLLAGSDVPPDVARRVTDLIMRLGVGLLLAPSDLFPLGDDTETRAFANTYVRALVEAASLPS